jgi:hypothetical protein
MTGAFSFLVEVSSGWRVFTVGLFQSSSTKTSHTLQECPFPPEEAPSTCSNEIEKEIEKEK